MNAATEQVRSGDAPLTSDVQDAWIELTEGFRAGLRSQIAVMSAMDAAQVQALASAMETALTNEARAATHDATVASRVLSLEREGGFGN